MSTADKDTLARLRAERQAQIAAAKERIKEQGRVLKLIKGHLEQGPDTIPGIAQAAGLSPREALWYVTAMRKYGLAVEGDKQGGYFQYALLQTEPSPPRGGAGNNAISLKKGTRLMAENTEKIVYVCTHAGEDPERASLPFVLANAALTMDVQAVVVLQGTGVFLAKKGYVENVFAAGLPPLKGLLASCQAQGGKLLVCVPCIKERKIEETDLIEGAEPTAAAKLTLELLSANASLVY